MQPSDTVTLAGPPRTEGVVFSVDGAATYHKAFNMSVNRTWDSFVVYRNGSDTWVTSLVILEGREGNPL